MFESNPLLSKAYQNSSNISVYAPAVTSSGDVYHIAAYCLLCEHFNWYMPKIFLCYDIDETLVHADRARNFLNLLFQDRLNCSVLEAQTKAHHYNPRNTRALECVQQQDAIIANELIINQKLLTALIQAAFLRFGFKQVNGILKYGFKNKLALKVNNKQIFAWIAKKVLETKKNLLNQPFVVIHHRYSTKANDGQNLSEANILRIINILQAQGMAVVIVNVSSEKYLVIPNVLSLNAFERTAGIDPLYSKFQHILLLSALSGLSGFQGIVGGTSGTLDVLAFMGINILNLHNFKVDRGSRHRQFAPHQDFRLLLQAFLMSVCDHQVNEDILLFWLGVRNFLYQHGTIPLGLEVRHDCKVEREIFKDAYRVNGVKTVINPYYGLQKQILAKQSGLKSCFEKRIAIKQQEEVEFNRISESFRQ
jgi:hypothetical protein